MLTGFGGGSEIWLKYIRFGSIKTRAATKRLWGEREQTQLLILWSCQTSTRINSPSRSSSGTFLSYLNISEWIIKFAFIFYFCKYCCRGREWGICNNKFIIRTWCDSSPSLLSLYIAVNSFVFGPRKSTKQWATPMFRPISRDGAGALLPCPVNWVIRFALRVLEFADRKFTCD